MAALNILYKPDKWRLYKETSKLSLKAILLHIGNNLLSIPFGHALHIKKKYKNIKTVLLHIEYEERQ